MKPRKQAYLALVSLLVLMSNGLAMEKKELTERYKKKFLVVVRDGLAIGTCAAHPGRGGLFGTEMPEIMVKIKGDQADYSNQGWHLTPEGCGSVVPEPLRKGEVLKVKGILLWRGEAKIDVENVSSHAIERGVGAFGHQTFERGAAELRFKLEDPKDYDAATELIERWVKPFDSEQEAAQFGNTASGVFVKQVKAGMTFAEVEAALGLPQTRVDLGEKVLYKYKDLTVEFHDGKVTDVR